MTRFTTSILLACLVALACNRTPAEAQEKPAAPDSLKAEKETRYLAFQIFTYGPNPIIATMGEGTNPQPARFPDKAVLRDYIEDIKRRIGTVGDQQTRLAVMLGHLAFDHGDAETTKFIELGFELALETDVAVGFHIDDSMFWARRKDLWSDPNNVEALDWDGTPCTGRILNWGKEPSAAPPQMCFNSKVIQREVQQRSALIGQAIQAGVNRLQQLKRPELFAGVIAGSETQIGQDFKTGKYLGYRALLNRGFSREHPPKDLDFEREKVVQEFIELWTTGLADAGVSPQKIYSHTCFLSRRAFGLGDSKEITYMQRNKETAYSQHNHFAPPSVAFGNHHRPGFSTYPQPGLFDDIYELLDKYQQVGWASCEGTNMQPSSGPGQTGMNMETYLAKMFNHGATLTTIFSWGVGGEANKNMGFRVVTEGEEALRAYRKFLKGGTLIEGKTVASLTERLPPKIHQIQKELPAWMQKAENKEKAAEAAALMQKMQEQLKAKNFDEVEKTADSILKMIGTAEAEKKPAAAAQDIPEEVRSKLTHNIGSSFLVFRDKVQGELKVTKEQKEKLDQHLRELLPDAMQVLQKSKGEREKYNQKTHEEMAAVLKETLNEGQRTRLHEMELQRDGLFGPAWNMKELQITDEQRKQFMAPTQETQNKTKALMEQIQKGANPDEIRPKVLQLRLDLEVKLEALLTDAQKKQWKEMLGKPVDLGVLFDGVSVHNKIKESDNGLRRRIGVGVSGASAPNLTAHRAGEAAYRPRRDDDSGMSGVYTGPDRESAGGWHWGRCGERVG